MFPPPRLLARPDAAPAVGEPIPVDPALTTAMPSPAEVGADPSAAAAALAVLDPSGAALAALSVLPAPSLSDEALIDAVTASQKLLACIAGKQQELLAEIARRDPDGEQFLRDEVACVLQTAPNSANLTLEAAQQLTGRLADTHDLLTGGYLPYGHARTLALGVRHCTDEVAAKVQERVLPRGCRQSAGEFRCAVRRAVARYDRKDEATQHAEAFAQRNVITYDEPDYMADVVLHLAADGAATVLTAINTWAVKTDTGDSRTLDQRRADAIVDICSAALDMPGLPKRHGLRPALSVTVAASTLAGQDDQPAELDGYGPIPASMARRIAALPGAVRHEIPVDNHGHILVQNDTADTYTPPARIARTVIARDVTCVHPGCGRSAHYCDLDHRTPWPAGPTSVDNLEPLCRRHHKLKHHSRWRLTKLADGTYEWTSPTRHTYRYRPPQLPVPAEPSTPEQQDPEPPPF